MNTPKMIVIFHTFCILDGAACGGVLFDFDGMDYWLIVGFNHV